jgi:hypothetical protein
MFEIGNKGVKLSGMKPNDLLNNKPGEQKRKNQRSPSRVSSKENKFPVEYWPSSIAYDSNAREKSPKGSRYEHNEGIQHRNVGKNPILVQLPNKSNWLPLLSAVPKIHEPSILFSPSRNENSFEAPTLVMEVRVLGDANLLVLK